MRIKKFLFSTFTALFLGVVSLVGWIAADSSSYLYLATSQGNSSSLEAALQEQSQVTTKLKKVNGKKTKKESTTNTTVSSSGSGVNLLLIAKMNEGYAKELLNLYADLQQGKITSKDTNFIEVSTLLGMQTNETGTYDGTLPKTYLPYKNGKVVWNKKYKSLSAKQMTVRGFGKKEWSVIGGGLCSWLSEGVDSPLDRTPWCMQGSMVTLAKSTINGSTNKGRSGSDSHYIPDNLASLNKRLNRFIKTYKVDADSLTEEESSILAANIHNRGEGGVLQCAFGFAYNKNGGSSSKKASKVLKNNNYDLGVGLNNVTSLLSNYMANSDASLSSITGSEYGRVIFAVIAAHSDNWFFGQDTYNYLSGKKSLVVKVWKVLYPNEKVTSKSALAQIKKKVKNLSTAIKEISGEELTSAQTSNIYNTASDYSDGSYARERGWGTVYCVVNKKIKYADGKKHTLVSAYDLVGGGYLVSGCMVGKYVYAKILKVSGVGVDPTNPDTYLNSLKGKDTYTPSGSSTTDSEIASWLSEIGVNSKKLSAKRVTLLESVHGRLGIPYKSCRHSKSCDGYCYDSSNPSHLDAATFVWRCFYDSGNKISSTTCKKLLEDKSFSRVAWKDRKPGDVLVTLGEKEAHAMFYIKDSGNSLTVAEAISGKETKVTKLVRGTTIYTDQSGTKSSTHFGKSGGKKYVLLRHNAID